MLLQLVQTINAYLSDYVLVILLIVVGLWYTVRTGFVQIRFFSEYIQIKRYSMIPNEPQYIV